MGSTCQCRFECCLPFAFYASSIDITHSYRIRTMTTNKIGTLIAIHGMFQIAPKNELSKAAIFTLLNVFAQALLCGRQRCIRSLSAARFNARTAASRPSRLSNSSSTRRFEAYRSMLVQKPSDAIMQLYFLTVLDVWNSLRLDFMTRIETSLNCFAANVMRQPDV